MGVVKNSVIPRHLLEIVYTQGPDVNSNLQQYINVSINDCEAGNYFTISTNRWAFDDINELIELLEKVKKAI